METYFLWYYCNSTVLSGNVGTGTAGAGAGAGAESIENVEPESEPNINNFGLATLL